MRHLVGHQTTENQSTNLESAWFSAFSSLYKARYSLAISADPLITAFLADPRPEVHHGPDLLRSVAQQALQVTHEPVDVALP